MLANLQYQAQSPSDIAEKAFYQSVFGTHPYASAVEGTLATINGLTQADVQAFHQRYYVAKNATIAIVGALDRVSAESVAALAIHLLAEGETVATLPEVTELTEAKNITINYPATQTTLIIGQPGMSRGDPDYFTLYLGNYVLGGSGLVSRLSEEVREKRGLAYSTYSYFLPLKTKGPFLLSLQTRNDQAKEALDLVQKVLQDFIAQGVTDKELQLAKQGITGGFPLKIKNNSSILSYVAMIGFYRLPLDYLDTFNNTINAITADMIKDAFNRRLHIDKLITVKVGNTT
jgi:zinc protease